jgi:cytochrome c
MKKKRLVTITTAALLAGSFLGSPSAYAVNERAALSLAQKSNCTKCHSLKRSKTGPSFQEIAENFRGDADAEQKLYTHVTTARLVEIDGKEEPHEVVYSKNMAEIMNLVKWILSR